MTRYPLILALATSAAVYPASQIERVVHPVQHHGPDDHPPEIGYVVDPDRSVVCYFFMRRHWYDGHPQLSCVHVGPDMLLDDEPVGGHIGG